MKEKLENISFGFWVYIMSDCVLFASLFAVYAVLKSQTFGGPAGQDFFDLPFILTETLILLTSSFTMGLGIVAAHANKKQWVLGALAITFLLGAAFLGMEVSEFGKLIAEGAGPSRSAFLSSFFTLVGTHGLHVFLGSIWMVVVMIHIYVRGVEKNLAKLTILSLFWHFLDVVWIFIYTFVYLLGIL